MRYRSSSVFSLRPWTACLHAGLACPALLTARREFPDHLQDFHLLWLAFPDHSVGFPHRTLAAAPRSLATTSGILSFPQATKMFQFAWFPRTELCVHSAVHGLAPMWVSPFGHLRLVSVAHTSPELFAVYRVLLRHLTPLASPICPCSFSYSSRGVFILPRHTFHNA